MTTPWNTFAAQNPAAVADRTQAWQAVPAPRTAFQPAFQPASQPASQTAFQPAFQQFPPTQAQPFGGGQQVPGPQFGGLPQQQFHNPGLPPQGPGFGGPQGMPPAPKPNRTALIVSLAVAAVLLIGGGVTAFLLLNKKSTATTGSVTNSGAVTPGAQTTTATSATTATSGIETTGTSTTTSGTSGTVTSTNSTGTSSQVSSSAGNGDQTTAEQLALTWLSFVNEGDYVTASALICEAQQQQFIDGFGGQMPANQLEVVSVTQSGENMLVVIGAVGGAGAQTELTMRPTNTGYFLICDGPLSENDLNW